MTSKENFKIVEEVSLWLVGLTLFIALLGWMIFSLQGIVKDDFETIYFFIGTAITLSGFTMLSGIFEGTGTKNKIVRKLFILSMLFLVSAFSFILFIGLYSGLKAVETTSWSGKLWNCMSVGLYLFGFFIFFMGFAFLIIALIQYSKQIDAGENKWWQLWK